MVGARSGDIDNDWHESGPWAVSGSGAHTIRWRYSKNGSGSSGSDCVWVDYVRWSGTMPDPNGWQEIEYVYDASGRRVEKKVDGDTEVKYAYDGDQVIAEYDANDTLLRKYVHGPGIDLPICLIESAGDYAGTHYYHYDALGSVVALTDPNGDVIQLYEYSVWGQVAASDPNHPNRFMFTGREFDKDTGLYYYRARYYHPEIGRFLQVDSVGYEAGMNLYRYCNNNPWNRTDPFGLTPCRWTGHTGPDIDDPIYLDTNGGLIVIDPVGDPNDDLNDWSPDWPGYNECMKEAKDHFDKCFDEALDWYLKAKAWSAKQDKECMDVCVRLRRGVREFCILSCYSANKTRNLAIWSHYKGRLIGCALIYEAEALACVEQYLTDPNYKGPRPIFF